VLNRRRAGRRAGSWLTCFTVFAKVDGEKFTAFWWKELFPDSPWGRNRTSRWVSAGRLLVPSPHDCKVPAENVLGEIARGT